MSKFFKIIDLIVGTINQTIAVYGMVLGVLLAFVNVVLRYVFDMSLPWAAELTNYLFIWSALFGAAYGFKQGAHISITLLIEKFSPSVMKMFLLFANLLSIIFVEVNCLNSLYCSGVISAFLFLTKEALILFLNLFQLCGSANRYILVITDSKV